MPSNKMSTKENTLHLPPRFPSTSSSESESETEYSSFEKPEKHRKENEVPLKKRKMKSLNGGWQNSFVWFWWGFGILYNFKNCVRIQKSFCAPREFTITK